MSPESVRQFFEGKIHDSKMERAKPIWGDSLQQKKKNWLVKLKSISRFEDVAW